MLHVSSDSVESPALHDLYSDAPTGGTGLPDSIDGEFAAEIFGWNDLPTDEELAEQYEASAYDEDCRRNEAASKPAPRFTLSIEPNGKKLRVVKFDTVKRTYRTVTTCKSEREAWDALERVSRTLAA